MSRRDAAARLFDSVTAERAAANLRTVISRVGRDARGLLHQQGTSLRLGLAENDYDGVSAWCLSVLHRSADPLRVPERAGRDLLPSWPDQWLVEPREQFHLIQVHALEMCAEGLLLAGCHGRAADCVTRAMALDPLRETASKLLVEILLREGNVAEALRRYRQFERLLASEVGAPPGQALQALVAPLLAAGYDCPSRRLRMH